MIVPGDRMWRLRPTIAVAVVVFAALALLGCARFLAAVPPEVSLSNLRYLSATAFEQRYEITLRFTNKTETSLTIDGMTVDLGVNGQAFGRGVTSQRVVVPRLGEATLPVVMSTTTSGLIAQILGVPESKGAIRYVVSGKLFILEDAGRRIEAPYTREGTLQLFGGPSG